MSQVLQLAPGARVGRYEVVRAIGSGGMGEVYQATHEFTKKSVALKVLVVAHEGREALVEKMRAEAMLLCRIRHEHLVEVYDAGIDHDRIWMAMELLDGESLRERLVREGATRPELALAWAAQIAEGMAAAHEAGVIHRDLKPENVFITRGGSLKVLDFGTAKFDGFGEAQTRARDRMGTLPYMSPEHLAGEPLDGRSDVFAVGILLYEMLAGRHPFASPEGVLPALHDLLGMMLAGTPASLAPFVGDAVWSLVARCLAPREERYASMRDLSVAARSLRAKISGVSSGALRLGISGQTQLGSSLAGVPGTLAPRTLAPRTLAPGTLAPRRPARGVAGGLLAVMALVAALVGAGGVVLTNGAMREGGRGREADGGSDATAPGSDRGVGRPRRETPASEAAPSESSESSGRVGPDARVEAAEPAGTVTPSAVPSATPPVVPRTWRPRKKPSDEPFRDAEPFQR